MAPESAAGPGDAIEIERKWRLGGVPDLAGRDVVAVDPIVQGYVVTTDTVELRVRRRGGRSYLSAKRSGSGPLDRQEWETEAPAWVVDTLLATTVAVVSKTRHVVRDGGLALEIDVFDGSLTGLCIVEAEWLVPADAGPVLRSDTKRAARAYVLPAWLGAATDVTGDRRYRNQWLARHGIPG